MNLWIFLFYENLPMYIRALKFTTAEIYRKAWPAGYPFRTINSLDFIQPRLSVIVLRIVCSTLVCSFAAPLIPYRFSHVTSCVTDDAIFRRTNPRAKWNKLKQISSQLKSHLFGTIQRKTWRERRNSRPFFIFIEVNL